MAPALEELRLRKSIYAPVETRKKRRVPVAGRQSKNAKGNYRSTWGKKQVSRFANGGLWFLI